MYSPQRDERQRRTVSQSALIRTRRPSVRDHLDLTAAEQPAAIPVQGIRQSIGSAEQADALAGDAEDPAGLFGEYPVRRGVAAVSPPVIHLYGELLSLGPGQRIVPVSTTCTVQPSFGNPATYRCHGAAKDGSGLVEADRVGREPLSHSVTLLRSHDSDVRRLPRWGDRITN